MPPDFGPLHCAPEFLSGGVSPARSRATFLASAAAWTAERHFCREPSWGCACKEGGDKSTGMTLDLDDRSVGYRA